METVNKHETWPWVHKVVAMFQYFIREGRLGLVAVVFLSLWPLGKEISEFFHFPPKERPFAKFLIAAVAFAVWGLTRAWIYRNTPQKMLVQSKSVIIESPIVIVKMETLQKEDRCVQEQQVYKNWWWRSIALLGVSIFVFGLYFALSASLVSTTKEMDGTEILQSQKVFFHPINPSSEFTNALAHRGGYEFVADNDAEWLDDALQKEGMRVTWTKLMLLACVLFATATFVYSTTLISSLPKPVVTEDDAASP